MLEKLNKLSLKKATTKEDVLKVIEELTELSEVLIKGINKGMNIVLLAEEMADVEIMLSRLKYRYDCEFQVTDNTFVKIQRQIGRWNEDSN